MHFLRAYPFIDLMSLIFDFVLDQMTATHQLKTAVTSVAYTSRSLLLSSLSAAKLTDGCESADAFMGLILTSLSNALLGMDANDPPKTLATMQLIGSIFSNVSTIMHYVYSRNTWKPFFNLSVYGLFS